MGSNATISCMADGVPGPVTYTWRKDGVVILGQSEMTLTLRDVSVSDIGVYECVPSNSEGTLNTSRTQINARSKESRHHFSIYVFF